MKKIKEHVMQDKYTKTRPQRTSKVGNVRCLTVDKTQLYEEFPYKNRIGGDKFKKLGRHDRRSNS